MITETRACFFIVSFVEQGVPQEYKGPIFICLGSKLVRPTVPAVNGVAMRVLKYKRMRRENVG